MSDNPGIRQAVFGVSGIVIVSKLIGFLREMVIAERFGTSLEYDIYLIAVAAPIFFNLVVVRAANYLTVPVLTANLANNDRASSGRTIWSIYNSLFVIVLGIIALVILFAPNLVSLIGSDLGGEQLDSAILYCRLASILILLGFTESFLRSTLNVKKHFVYPVAGIIIFNIVIISSIIFLTAKLSVGAILLGLLAGTIIQILFLLLKLWNFEFLGYFNLKLFGPDVRKVLVFGSAIIAVELMTSTFFIIDRYFASDMMPGVVSALNYCSLLVMLPVTIIGFSVAAVTFPYLSERSGESRRVEFAKLLKSSLAMSLIVGLPSGVFYFFFAREVTAGVFLRGAFDLVSLEITSNILVTMSPYLIALFVYTILIQACYAAGMQKQVLYIAMIGLGLKLIITYILKTAMGYPGLGLAASIVQVTMVVLLIVALAKNGRLTQLRDFFGKILKIAIASLPIVLLWLYFRTMPDFELGMDWMMQFRVIIIGAIAIIAFIVIGYLIRITEIRTIFKR